MVYLYPTDFCPAPLLKQNESAIFELCDWNIWVVFFICFENPEKNFVMWEWLSHNSADSVPTSSLVQIYLASI